MSTKNVTCADSTQIIAGLQFTCLSEDDDEQWVTRDEKIVVGRDPGDEVYTACYFPNPQLNSYQPPAYWCSAKDLDLAVETLLTMLDFNEVSYALPPDG
jgi:hypothetical protein